MPAEIINSPHYHVPVRGFTQAVKVGVPGATMIFVSGLTARRPDGSIASEGDIRGQTRQIFESLKSILAEAEATLADVVRTVTYLRRMEDHAGMQEVKNEFFPAGAPPSTSIEISRLYDERQLVEIEATAIVTAR